MQILPKRIVRRQPCHGHVGRAADDREEIVEVVGNAAGKPTNAFHLLRLSQLGLQLDALGDVDLGSHQSDTNPLRVPLRGSACENGPIGPVPLLESKVDLEVLFITDQVVAHHRKHPLAIVGVDAPLPFLLREVDAAPIKLLLPFWRDIDLVGTQIPGPQAHLASAERHLQALLALSDRLLRLLLFGDVDVRSRHACGLSRRVRDECPLRKNGAVGAVLPPHSALEMVVGPRVGEIRTHRIQTALQIIGVDAGLPLGEIVRDLIHGIAQLAFPLRREVHLVRRQVPVPQANVGRGRRQPHPGIRFLKGEFGSPPFRGVSDEALECHQCIAFEDSRAPLPNPALITIHVTDAVLQHIRSPTGDPRLHLLPHAIAVARHDELTKCTTSAREILSRYADDVHNATADILQRPVRFVGTAIREPAEAAGD